MNSAFGTKHLVILAISILLIIGLYLLSKKLKFNTLCKALFVVGIVSELVKVVTYIVINEEKYGGILPKTDLPFHLCSIQILFIMIVTMTNNEKVKRFLLSFMMPSCLVGGFAALLLPTSSSLNTWPITFQYNLYHIAIIVFALNILTNKEIKLEIKDYFNCLKFLLALFFFAIYINSIVYDGVSNINFMYVASPPMSGLPFLNEDYGWLVYITHYAMLVLLVVTLCYIKPIILAIKNRKNTHKILEENSKTESEK